MYEMILTQERCWRHFPIGPLSRRWESMRSTLQEKTSLRLSSALLLISKSGSRPTPFKESDSAATINPAGWSKKTRWTLALTALITLVGICLALIASKKKPNLDGTSFALSQGRSLSCNAIVWHAETWLLRLDTLLSPRPRSAYGSSR